MAVKKQSSFINMDEVDDQTIKNITKGAALTDKKPSKAGRKKKAEADKAGEMMAVYFTTEQKETVQGYCEKIGIPFSNLVKQMLAQNNII
ncbi:MAG: hypothetical protein H6Q13_3586 [Bacteroidetes bacterium]|nr:hypothetical protein [Bacteroidota bacterium]